MNIQQCDILMDLYSSPFVNQRRLSESTGYSLGAINHSLKALLSDGYLSGGFSLTDKAVSTIHDNSPNNAIILAAGFGMRMVPINRETPKAFVEVKGELLIERLINQLHDVGIYDIKIVVGFMKESFEYLIDEFGVELIVNTEYSVKNNLHSLALASEKISNTYIVPCDIWCKENPFRTAELYSWYMVADASASANDVRVNRKMELVKADLNSYGNAMVGIAYLSGHDAERTRNRINCMAANSDFDNDFWEKALFDGNRMTVHARVVNSSNVVEINTYEQLRELDSNSSQLRAASIDVICEAFKCTSEDISNISVLKKGMTNRSFLFECHGKKYIMRIPGEGTDMLIDRKHEAAVYYALTEKGICDNIIYINPSNGFKISEYVENARVCNPLNPLDVKKCMQKLRSFHEQGLQVEFYFDIFAQIDFYESLWHGMPSAFRDYSRTKANVLSLKPFIEKHAAAKALTHIDAVPDNFLFEETGTGEKIYLIDWEYAGMQDPHVDIAMFCTYSMYDRQQADALIDAYFTEGCTFENRVKIYCYIAACGLLWSNWCEYKRSLGVEFGEYSLRQYRYAKDYYRIAVTEIERLQEK